MKVISSKDSKNEYDFVFVCESKVRELESCCLIGQELENRGYTVGVLNWWLPNIDVEYKPVKTKVLMAHAVYKDESLNRELSFIDGETKVINLQWEQIYSIKDLTNPNAPWKMEGDAKRVIHLSWGNENFNKLTTYDGISADRIRIVGQVSMDFLSPKLRNYYMSRETLLAKYNIPLDKKICLFISSFSFTNLPENVQDPELVELSNVSFNSQRKILEWIQHALDINNDIFFIYRPHPAEANNTQIKDIEKKYKHFRCISDLSVKQWIIASDIIYNWYSTSIADVYFANRSCHILRPIDIPHELECKIFENGKFIRTEEDFLKSMHSPESSFPIPLENISFAYSNDQYLSYLRIADECEKVIKEDTVYFKSNIKKKRSTILLSQFKRTYIGKLLLGFKHYFENIKKPSENDLRNKSYAAYTEEMFKNNNFRQEDVDDIIHHIQSVLYQ